MRRKKLTIILVADSLVVAAIAVAAVFGPGWAQNKAQDQISEMLGRRVVVEGGWGVDLGWSPTLRLESLRIANADWSDTPWMAEVAALEVSVDLRALIDGRIVVPKLPGEGPDVLLERAEDARANWQFGERGSEEEPTNPEGDGEPAEFPVIRDLLITDAHVRYLDHARGTQLASTVERGAGALTEEHSVFTAHGDVDGEPLGLELEAGALNQLSVDEQPFPLDARLELGSLSTRVEGSLRDALEPAGADLRLSIEGEGTPPIVTALAGAEAPDLPAYGMDAVLRQEDHSDWRLDDFQLRFGRSEMHGTAGLDLSGDTPDFTADFTFPRVDIEELTELASAFAGNDNENGGTALDDDETPAEALDLSALRAFNADIALDAEEVAGAQAPLGSASLALTLRDGRLSVDPLQADIADNTIALRGNLDAAEDPATGRFVLNLGAIDLTRTLPGSGVEDPPPGSLSGQIGVDITGELPRDDRDLALPGLGRIELAPSELRYMAPSLDTDITANLRNEGDGDEQRLLLTAEGRYRGEPLAVDFAGDSPQVLRDPASAYRLDLTLAAGDTELEVDGRIGEPRTFQGLDLNVALAGPNPARLTPLLDFPLPELPPYSLAGQLTRAGETVKVTGFDGRVGDSDLRGDVQIDLGGERPAIAATLTSVRLDFHDLAGLIGATPEAGPGDTVSEGQRREAEREEDDPYLFPRDPLDLDRAAGAMDATIDYRGKRVEAPGLPLDDVRFTAEIGDGQISLSPLEFVVGEGGVRLELAFDTREQPFTGEVSGEVRRIDLRQALAPLDIADDSLGVVGGRLQFWVEGDSIADFLATADGGLLLVMTEGQLDLLLIELAGLDVEETLTTLLGDDEGVPIDCAFIDISAEDGIADLETAVIDTADTIFLADGSMNFREEQLDLVIEPRPKDFSLFTLRSTLHIDGQMADPEFSIGDSLIGRGLAAAPLAAAAPIAALVPLIEPGTGEDSIYCGGLVEAIDRARSEN